MWFEQLCAMPSHVMVILCVKIPPPVPPTAQFTVLHKIVNIFSFKCGGCQRQFATLIYFLSNLLRWNETKWWLISKSNGDNKFQFNFDAIAFILFVCLILFFHFLRLKLKSNLVHDGVDKKFNFNGFNLC